MRCPVSPLLIACMHLPLPIRATRSQCFVDAPPGWGEECSTWHHLAVSRMLGRTLRWRMIASVIGR